MSPDRIWFHSVVSLDTHYSIDPAPVYLLSTALLTPTRFLEYFITSRETNQTDRISFPIQGTDRRP